MALTVVGVARFTVMFACCWLVRGVGVTWNERAGNGEAILWPLRIKFRVVVAPVKDKVPL
jgi:hypothetical protein